LEIALINPALYRIVYHTREPVGKELSAVFRRSASALAGQRSQAIRFGEV